MWFFQNSVAALLNKNSLTADIFMLVFISFKHSKQRILLAPWYSDVLCASLLCQALSWRLWTTEVDAEVFAHLLEGEWSSYRVQTCLK